MSLFPAYANDNCKSNIQTIQTEHSKEDAKVIDSSQESWLQNQSFSLNISQIPLPSTSLVKEIPLPLTSTLLENKREPRKPYEVILSSDDEEPDKVTTDVQTPSHHSRRGNDKKRKSAKKRKKSSRDKETSKSRSRAVSSRTKVENLDNEVFFEDRKREKANLSVSTLYRPAVPWYECRWRGVLGATFHKKKLSKKKFHKDRYHVRILEEDPGAVRKDRKEEGEDRSAGSVLEEEMSKKTAEFNKNLAEDPHNVNTWLGYSRYQDTVSQFERTFRRGGGASGSRVAAERKLAILDKALSHNPDSVPLLQERFVVADEVFPADQVSAQLAALTEKQPSNLTLWSDYIGSTQCSLAMCSASAVLAMYGQALGKLHQSRRGVPALQVKITEQKILALTLQCGLFLRQAGLWEQLWILLRLCLELNVFQSSSASAPNRFNIKPSIPEDQVITLEDSILNSQLPLPTLWLRVEKLREGVHWLPWDKPTNCEDPQRVVFPDDVSDFLHPVTTSSLDIHLVTIVLVLLKVPLLPSRHTALHAIRLTKVTWGLDTIESLLPAFTTFGTVDLGSVDILKDITELTSGPQYLFEHLGQEHYLNFVINVFQACGESLKEPSQTAVFVWWLRFERLLISLDNQGRCKLPQHRKKKLKSSIKDFLKRECFRNNLVLYREYALIEYELGNHDSAFKILKTAILARDIGVPVVCVLDDQEKSGLCSLYRTLCELSLHHDLSKTSDAVETPKQEIAVQVLVALGLGIPLLDVPRAMSLEQVAQTVDKFHHITAELLVDSDSVAAEVVGTEHLLPDFIVDWISCYAWFLSLTHSPWTASAMLLDALVKIPRVTFEVDSVLTVWACRREALLECYVMVMHHHCQSTAGTYSELWGILHQALAEFPNNLNFLATVAKIECSHGCVGSPWWKLARSLSLGDAVAPQLFHLFLANRRHVWVEDAAKIGHELLHPGGPVVPDLSHRHRLSAVYGRLCTHRATRSCPLLWRMYLQFLFTQENQSACRAAFYQAVERCPWVKALYLDAVKLLPEELPHIQDLLIEKELRLHVTPEELDILRSDTVT
uniref:Protein NRDE2 homolog n=1 Tax=Timema tahoe TaxID=61484 RepID=A0A7R9IAV7_9NEOP|nr:unnamed protein product [Timema tahoe]